MQQRSAARRVSVQLQHAEGLPGKNLQITFSSTGKLPI